MDIVALTSQNDATKNYNWAPWDILVYIQQKQTIAAILKIFGVASSVDCEDSSSWCNDTPRMRCLSLSFSNCPQGQNFEALLLIPYFWIFHDKVFFNNWLHHRV